MVTSTTRQTPEAHRSPVQTSKRFSIILERRQGKVLTYIFLQLLDDGTEKLLCRCSKPKVVIHQIRTQVRGIGVLTESLYILLWWLSLFIKMRTRGLFKSTYFMDPKFSENLKILRAVCGGVSKPINIYLFKINNRNTRKT